MSSSTLFTWGPDNVDSLLTTTQSVIEKGREFLNDQIFTAIPLLNYLNTRARVMKQGGASILVPVMFGKNTTFKAYSGSDVLDTSGQEGLTMAQYKWVNYGGTITIFGDEMRLNAGQGKLKDLLQAKTEQAVMSARDRLAIDLWAGSQAAKAVIPLPVLVSDTGTLADINAATNTWWQAQVIDSVGDFATNGLDNMRRLRDDIQDQAQVGNPNVDLILTTSSIFEAYEENQVQNIRYQDTSVAKASFDSLMFAQAMIQHDPNCPTGEMFFLSTEAMRFVVHTDANWQIGKFVEPTDQDARSAKVIWMGNLVTLNRRRQGKLTDITVS